MIPQYTLNSLKLYVEQGIPPGSFLCAVLENNLFSAVNRADTANLAALPEIVKYIYNEVPSIAWGNSKSVSEYIDSFRTKECSL